MEIHVWKEDKGYEICLAFCQHPLLPREQPLFLEFLTLRLLRNPEVDELVLWVKVKTVLAFHVPSDFFLASAAGGCEPYAENNGQDSIM